MAGGVIESRYVRSWIEGTPPRRSETLRAAWRAAYSLYHYGDRRRRSGQGLMGQNPAFDFRALVRVLRENNDDESRSAVVRAAVQFASA
jgi:hypothetical protein